MMSAPGVDTRTESGWTPLQCAAYTGQVDTVRELLARGAVVDAQPKSGTTALMRAASSGHLEVVELLLERQARVEMKNNLARNALQLAARECHVQVAKRLAQHFTPETLFSYMNFEAMKGNFRSVKTYVEIGVDIYRKDNGLMVFHNVAHKGHVKIVEYLLDRDPFLLEEVTEMGWPALHLAAMMGQVKVVRVLLDRGAHIDAQNSSRWTALMNAAHHDKVDVVCELLERGADKTIRIQTKTNETALSATNNEVIRILLGRFQREPKLR